jgi:hypothetical protein
MISVDLNRFFALIHQLQAIDDEMPVTLEFLSLSTPVLGVSLRRRQMQEWADLWVDRQTDFDKFSR